MTEQQTTILDKLSYQLEVTRPVWLPYNDTARDIVAALVDQLGYPTSGPKAERYAVVVASLFKATQTHALSANNQLPHYIGIQRRASAWSQYPLVGRTVSNLVVDDFLKLFGGLCCTNPLGDVFPLTPDGFSLRPPYAVCQEL